MNYQFLIENFHSPPHANSIPTGDVCTVGPASQPEEILKQLIQEGMMKGLQKSAQTEWEAHLGVMKKFCYSLSRARSSCCRANPHSLGSVRRDALTKKRARSQVG